MKERAPWSVALTPDWGAAAPLDLRIPNPVSFIVQKLLIHDDRPGDKKAQDLLYIHDTLELFAPELEHLVLLWREVHCAMNDRWVQRTLQLKEKLFGTLNDQMRDAAAIPADRDLDPERMRAMCAASPGNARLVRTKAEPMNRKAGPMAPIAALRLGLVAMRARIARHRGGAASP